MICTLLRKPLTGTVVQTFSDFQAGGMNIDASRVGYSSNEPDSGANFYRNRDQAMPENRTNYFGGDDGVVKSVPSKVGRFPANLILNHRGECQLLGSKRVKANQSSSVGSGQGPNRDPSIMAWGKGGVVQRGTAEPDGKETVESWQCVDGCSVKGLDEQSGVSAGTGGSKSGMSALGQNSGWNKHCNRVTEIVRANDSGGASRFFKQVAQ